MNLSNILETLVLDFLTQVAKKRLKIKEKKSIYPSFPIILMLYI